MKENISIQLKAAFLLIVFSLNTLVGFACAIGVDMGFNSSHHHDEDETEISILSHSEMHHHHDETNGHSHKHGKGNCCDDSVIKISQTDKAVPQINAIVSPVFFALFITSYSNVSLLYPSQITSNIKYFTRSYHPPITNIRIAIQSFQI